MWPEVWTNLSPGTAKNEKNNEWADEKPKLEIARRMRGIYFIDPEDKEYEETMLRMQEEMLEVHMEAAKPLQKERSKPILLPGNSSRA